MCLCIIVITLLGILKWSINNFVVDVMVDVVGVVVLDVSLYYSHHSIGDTYIQYYFVDVMVDVVGVVVLSVSLYYSHHSIEDTYIQYFVVDMMIDVVGVVVLSVSLYYSHHSTGGSEVFCCRHDD